MAGRLIWLAVLALTPLGGVLAEPLPDPTRPPDGLVRGSGDAAPAVTGPVLQSVMISGARRAAMIDGTLVELGGRYGEWRLVAVMETRVTLRGPGGTQELKLFPAVEKRLVRAPAPEARGKGER